MRETCPVYMKLFNESFYLPDIQKEEKENKVRFFFIKAGSRLVLNLSNFILKMFNMIDYAHFFGEPK